MPSSDSSNSGSNSSPTGGAGTLFGVGVHAVLNPGQTASDVAKVPGALASDVAQGFVTALGALASGLWSVVYNAVRALGAQLTQPGRLPALVVAIVVVMVLFA